jgi:hypothetical protein
MPSSFIGTQQPRRIACLLIGPRSLEALTIAATAGFCLRALAAFFFGEDDAGALFQWFSRSSTASFGTVMIPQIALLSSTTWKRVDVSRAIVVQVEMS